jgi:hypothetical protein
VKRERDRERARHSVTVWRDPVKAQQWVLAQLKGQGITMRAA